MRYEENWENKQVIRIERRTSDLNNLISDYVEHGYIVKQISYSESWTSWGVAILFEKP